MYVDNRQDQTVMDRNVAVLVSACFFRVGICHIQSFNAGDQRRTGKSYRLEMASRSEVFCRNRREHRIRGNLIRDLIIMAKVSAI